MIQPRGGSSPRIPSGWRGGVNLYAYAGNNPIGFSDPFGLASCPKDAGGDGKTESYADCDPGTSGWYANRLATGEGNAAVNTVGGVLASCGESGACQTVLAVASLGAAAAEGFAARGATAAVTSGGTADAVSGIRLAKSLASQAQMGEAGTVIAGQGSKAVFRDAAKVAAEYGGQAADWVKKSSSAFRAADGVAFETHWVENLTSGARVMFKTKFVP